MDPIDTNHESHASDKALTDSVTQPTSMESALMQIARDSAGRFQHPFDQIDHGTWLYDERGLP
jgi:hypothetical protein